MTASTQTAKQSDTSLTRDWISFLQYHLGRYLGGRRGFIVMGVSALAVGGVLSWDWLVAVGLAPLIVAIAPCAVMCALGLCMSRMGGQSCASESSTTDGEGRARSTSRDPGAEAPSEPVAVAADRRADEQADSVSGEGERRTAARDRTEAPSERG